MEFGEKSRRGSEPDVILDSRDLLVFVEAKVGSANDKGPSNPACRDGYERGGNGWYSKVFKSNFDTVAVEEKKYQLLRLWLLGTWIAAKTRKRFVLVNLLRDGAVDEADIGRRFGSHIRVDDGRSFVRMTWEQVEDQIIAQQGDSDDKRRMLWFFENKTLGYSGPPRHQLRRAFTV